MFGVSATTIASIAGPAIGGLLGGGGQQSQQTQNKTIDPRMDPYVYGDNGVLKAAQDWYSKNKSGLNDQMVTGMNNQWNQLAASKPGFDQMQSIGMGLLGGGVAGNPFTTGQASLSAGIPMPQYQHPQISNQMIQSQQPNMRTQMPPQNGGGQMMQQMQDPQMMMKMQSMLPSTGSNRFTPSMMNMGGENPFSTPSANTLPASAPEQLIPRANPSTGSWDWMYQNSNPGL